MTNRESLILKVFETIDKGEKRIISRTGEKLTLPSFQERSIEEIELNLEAEDLESLIEKVQMGLTSDNLQTIFSHLRPYTSKPPKFTDYQEKLENLKDELTKKKKQIQELKNENDRLQRRAKLSDEERKQRKLQKDLEDLKAYGTGEYGTWKDFQIQIKEIFVDYLGFLELPRNMTKSKAYNMMKKAPKRLEKQKERYADKEAGTVDTHLRTRNTKKFKTLHIEAKSSHNTVDLDVSEFINHNKEIQPDFGIIIGPKFKPIDVYKFIDLCEKEAQRNNQGKEDFHFCLITLEALSYLIQFMVEHRLTQEFLLKIIKLNSYICSDSEIIDIVDSIENRAKYNELTSYFNEDLIIPEEKRDIDEPKVKSIQVLCNELYEEKKKWSTFKKIIEKLQEKWSSKAPFRETFSYEELHDDIYSILKKYYEGGRVVNESLKLLIFFSVFDFVDFKPSEEERNALHELKSKIKVEKEQDLYFKDKWKFLGQFL